MRWISLIWRAPVAIFNWWLRGVKEALGYEPSAHTQQQKMLTAREERERRTITEAGKIKYREEQAKGIEEHVRAVLNRNIDAQLKEIAACYTGAFKGALELKRQFADGELDPFAVYNETTGNTSTAKQQEDEQTVIRRLYGMRLTGAIEALVTMFNEYHGKRPESPAMESEAMLLKQAILRQLQLMEKEFGSFGSLQTALDRVRPIVGTLSEDMKPAGRNGKTAGKPRLYVPKAA